MEVDAGYDVGRNLAMALTGHHRESARWAAFLRCRPRLLPQHFEPDDKREPDAALVASEA